MSAKPVRWVLVVRFGSTAHRALYGRLSGSTLYSKDYIQLSRRPDFIDDLLAAFPGLQGDAASVPVTYSWPTGNAQGTIHKRSADRPHLAWTTNSPPPPWRMSENPTAFTVETVRGNPNHDDEGEAELEYDQLASSAFGQPFLIAVALEEEPATLHLRVTIAEPDPAYEWADLQNTPAEIQALAAATSPSSALAWRLFNNAEPKLYFDPDRKIDPWDDQAPASTTGEHGSASHGAIAATTLQSSGSDSDSTAESLDHSDAEVAEFDQKVTDGDYVVPDSTATVKTRGSAQRVFAQRVKDNYGWKCAITGIIKPEFLIASHIVPWSVDETIRLDPTNGICLSVLVDRAFEHGFLVIEDDLTLSVRWALVGDDEKLREQLVSIEGNKLNPPNASPPKVEYLKRRRVLQPPLPGE